MEQVHERQAGTRRIYGLHKRPPIILTEQFLRGSGIKLFKRNIMIYSTRTCIRSIGFENNEALFYQAVPVGCILTAKENNIDTEPKTVSLGLTKRPPKNFFMDIELT